MQTTDKNSNPQTPSQGRDDYSFILDTPTVSTHHTTLRERFGSLTNMQRVMLFSAVGIVFFIASISVLTLLQKPTIQTSNKTSAILGTADKNNDGIIDESDNLIADSSTTDTTSQEESANSTDPTDEEISWWQRLIASTKSKTTTTTDDTTVAYDDTTSDTSTYDDSAGEDYTEPDIADEADPNDPLQIDETANEPVAAPSKPSSGTLLTIATWNVLYTNSPSNMKKGISTILSSAQVLGLQEVGTGGSVDLDRAVAGLASDSIGVYEPSGNTPIIWNAKMYTKRASGYKIIDPYGFRKTVTYVRLRNIANGKEFYVYNFHAVVGLPDKPSESCSTTVCKAYRAEMKELMPYISSRGSDVPVFSVGDYNADFREDKACRITWLPCRSYRSINMKSGYELLNLSGIGDSESSSSSGTRLIDYVFSKTRSDVTPISIDIIGGNATCRRESSVSNRCWNGSDHKPSLLTVKLQ